MRIDPASLDQLLHPTLDPKALRDVIATGLPASPGAASGEIVFSSTRPSNASTPAARSSWCASRRARKTSTACMRRKEF